MIKLFIACGLFSRYPVILSIENHCSIEQQNIMADYMKDILGDMLYVAPVDDSKEYLPSPEDLIHKVLVKVCNIVCIYVCMYVCIYVCMYVCMYACIYVCMYICMYIRTYVCTYVRTYVCMYVYMYDTYVCMYVCTYVRMYVCMYVCMYVGTYICTYVCMYVHMYICMYVCTYVCMYVHMYVCTYIWYSSFLTLTLNIQVVIEIRIRHWSAIFFEDQTFCMLLIGVPLKMYSKIGQPKRILDGQVRAWRYTSISSYSRYRLHTGFVF